jgi:hypothetical protein
LRFQEELSPLVEARLPAGSGRAAARAVIAAAFACLDAASMTLVKRDGGSDIMDLYDECVKVYAVNHAAGAVSQQAPCPLIFSIQQQSCNL